MAFRGQGQLVVGGQADHEGAHHAKGLALTERWRGRGGEATDQNELGLVIRTASIQHKTNCSWAGWLMAACLDGRCCNGLRMD